MTSLRTWPHFLKYLKPNTLLRPFMTFISYFSTYILAPLAPPKKKKGPSPRGSSMCRSLSLFGKEQVDKPLGKDLRRYRSTRQAPDTFTHTDIMHARSRSITMYMYYGCQVKKYQFWEVLQSALKTIFKSISIGIAI